MDRLLKILVLVAVGIVAILVPALSADVRRSKTSESHEQTPTSIELMIHNQKLATLTNTEALMSLIRSGWRVPPHKCTVPGRLVLHFGSGSVAEMGFLPGHTQTNYESLFKK